jgi:hypothetical protein
MNRFRLERQFGGVVGGVFLCLGLWTIWRESWPSAISQTTAGLGLVLLILGLAVPRALVYPRRAWMALAEALGFVSTRVILGAVFFLIMTPLGFIMRRAGWDPLAGHRRSGQSRWVSYSPRQSNPKHYEQMF